ERSALNSIAAANQVTINIVFQTLWGILLQKYNNCGDVVFGAVVSGRPPEIEAIENMVGLFINTIPVRVTSRENQRFIGLLKRMGEKAAASRLYEYLPLAEIQSQSALKGNLINHIMALENYPLDETIRNSGKNTGAQQGLRDSFFNVVDMEFHEQTNYDFDISINLVGLEKGFPVKLSYNPRVYETDIITNVGLHLREMIRQVADNPGIFINYIEILTRQEKQQL
ncbi:MAG: non-ribosomal peptide synthetase, partial [bacterium]|nr:non-ribosomal peptide synthetase [bacterium]